GDRLGGAGVTGSPIYFTPLDDGSVIAISAAVKRGETPAKAFERIEQFVAETIRPKLGAGGAAGAKQQLGVLLRRSDLPEAALVQNPYGVAFSLARRDQIGFEGARLGRAMEALTDQDLKRAAKAIFDPGRHAGAIAGVGDPNP